MYTPGEIEITVECLETPEYFCTLRVWREGRLWDAVAFTYPEEVDPNYIHALVREAMHDLEW